MESCRWSGAARTIEEPAWLLRQIGAQTGKNGSSRAELWAVEDAPPDIIAAQKRGIVGIEIAIETIDGKWKVSQNRPLADRQGVAQGLWRSTLGGGGSPLQQITRDRLGRKKT